ncbi:MAG: M28 family peptidase [Bacteroides sp.]|nr:M28 family peptidase [Bacteroides sp.]
MHKILVSLLSLFLVACASGSANTQRSETGADTIAVAHPEFNADSAFSYVETQVKFGPRVPGSDAHSRCVDFLAGSLKRFGADSVSIQRATVKSYDDKNVPIANILASFNSAAPKRILLLAHYDTRPWADNDPSEANHQTPIDGANDGGSGVAVILELARLIGQSQPQVGVDILFTDAEDSGISSTLGNTDDTWCLGTQYWAANSPYSPENRPAYGILLDMVGGRNAVFPREYNSTRMAPQVVDRVWSIAAASPHASRFPNSIGGGVTDDHLFVNSAGIPCIDIIETANPETGSFPPTWHTVADNLSNIAPATMKAVGSVLLDVIYSEPIN